MSNILNSPEFNKKFLNIICKESKICLDFGNYGKQVNDYFDNFQNFKFAKPATRIGEASKNGAVLLIPFEKNGYKTFALLKFSLSKKADNLMYEAYVGTRFINYFSKVFPSFTDTYGYFLLNSITDYDKVMEYIHYNLPIDINAQIKLESHNNFILNLACNNPILITPLIQYFSNFNTFFNEYNNDFNNTNKEIPCLLYQIYFVLDILKDIFTHYDLHANNAGYYKPFTNKYILMNYHLENGTIISFPTIYISKIIDYGRCHFNNNSYNTNDLIDLVCENCKPRCGYRVGFSFITGKIFKDNWINPRVKNCSHDLRLISILKSKLKDKYNFFNDVIYLEKYGTPEDLTPYDKTEKIIRNVSGARESLEDFLPNWCKTELTENYYINLGITKAGDIHIYADKRPYEYIIKHNI